MGKEILSREMEFSVLDRVVMLNLLPVQGDVYSLKLIREFREALGFSDAEQVELNVRPGPDGKGVSWDDEHQVLPKKVVVGSRIHTLVENRFHELDANKQLGMEALDLYERFIEAQDEEVPSNVTPITGDDGY